MIYGNIDGVKKSAIEELDRLYKVKCPKDEVCSIEIIEVISRVSSFIEREVSVAIDRRGNIKSIAIGDSTSVEIETLDIREKKLAGVRIIHTHPNGMSNLSALDISALIKLKLDAIVAIGIYEGKILDCSLGMLTVNDIERIGDHAENIAELAKDIVDLEISFSDGRQNCICLRK